MGLIDYFREPISDIAFVDMKSLFPLVFLWRFMVFIF